eukprot:gene20503-26769_t
MAEENTATMTSLTALLAKAKAKRDGKQRLASSTAIQAIGVFARTFVYDNYFSSNAVGDDK